MYLLYTLGFVSVVYVFQHNSEAFLKFFHTILMTLLERLLIFFNFFEKLDGMSGGALVAGYVAGCRF